MTKKLIPVWAAVVIGSACAVATDAVVAVHRLPDDCANILSLVAAEVRQAPHRVCANFCAPENMYAMFFTLDTSQFEMSWLKACAC